MDSNDEIKLLKSEKRKIISKYDKKILKIKLRLAELKDEKIQKIQEIDEQIRLKLNEKITNVCEHCLGTKLLYINGEDLVCHKCKGEGSC